MSAEDMSPRRRRRRYFLGFDEPQLPVKREPDEDIKDFAETTMNELLGWYGYEKVDSRDTQGLNLTHFAPGRARSDPSVIGTPPSSGADSDEGGNSLPETADQPAGTASDAASPGPDISSTISDESVKQQHQNASALPLINKHPGPPDSPGLPPGCIVCAWCQKVGVKLFTLKAPGGQKAFCSELCFDQCRRAAFKKSKVCDWCKHVRHTVSYVDFQDGEQRLQFCSDKCLNQYKMNLFCRETRAHLQAHARLKEAACKPPAPGLGLITPELWLRDCSNGAAADENDSDGDRPPAAPPSSPPLPEKKETPPGVVVAKDKPPKKSSPKSTHKKPHKSHRDRRGATPNGPQPRHHSAAPRQSPGHTSPSSSASRSSHAANGVPPLLSPASLGIPRPPLPLHPGPHHGQGHLNFDPGRQHQLMHAGVVPPPPFPFLAQQQMEVMLGRAQRGMDLRSAAKGPPPHLPLPPWIVPPFPPVPPPPQVPPPSPSFTPSSAKAQHHHRSGHASNHKGTAQHGARHRHHGKKTPAGQSGSCNPPPPYFGPPFQAPSFQPPFSPLVPPVTVMVPFPLPIPIPLPVPVPIPIPPDVMERYKASKSLEKSDRGRRRLSTPDETNNRDSYKGKMLEETAHRETWPRSLEANDRDIYKVTQPEETGDKELWQPSLEANDGDSTKPARSEEAGDRETWQRSQETNDRDCYQVATSGETGDKETWQRSQETNDEDCYQVATSGDIGDRETWQRSQETNDRDCYQGARPVETGDREPWARSQETSDRDKPKSVVLEGTGGRDMNWVSRLQETIDQPWSASFQESNYRDRNWLASLQEVENKGKARCEQRRKRKMSSGSSCSKISRMLSDAEAASPESFLVVQRPTSADLDVDSVSCSPLSDAPSSCDDNAYSHRPPADEAAGLGLARPSPVASQAGADVLDGRVSTSPTDLSVTSRDQPPPLTGGPIGFKKRHLREQLPLVV